MKEDEKKQVVNLGQLVELYAMESPVVVTLGPDLSTGGEIRLYSPKKLWRETEKYKEGTEIYVMTQHQFENFNRKTLHNLNSYKIEQKNETESHNDAALAIPESDYKLYRSVGINSLVMVRKCDIDRIFNPKILEVPTPR